MNSIEADADVDGDGLLNDVDTDDDNDGIEDASDPFPLGNEERSYRYLSQRFDDAIG